MRTIATLFLSFLFFISFSWAHGTYTGYSGAPGRSTCATSCHGTTGGTIVLAGFPTNYTPGQVYQLVVRHTSGTTIRNFNASCRVGTGSVNAGTITAGLNCSVYNVTGETNGVHLTSVTRDSGLFSWTAPTAGTGTVRMYLGGLQGSSSGQNTVISITSNEAVGNLPSAATNPTPPNNATLISPGLNMLAWSSATSATSYDVYFGTVNSPAFLGNRTDTTFSISNTLALGAIYYWRIDSRNTSGATTGMVWQFTTLTVASPSNPVPDIGETITTDTVMLQWQLGTSPVPTNLVLHFGQVNPPPVFSSLPVTTNFTVDTMMANSGACYWSIDQVFPWGTVAGPVWNFMYQEPDGVKNDPLALPIRNSLSSVYPNPFNPTTTISFHLMKSSNVELKLFDMNGRDIGTIVNNRYQPGSYHVAFDGKGFPSGTYFYRLSSGERTEFKKMVLMK